MKKSILLSMLALITLSVKAQVTIPNGDFETWNQTSFEELQHYRSSNFESFYNCNTTANCEKTSDAYTGSWAVKLTTRGSGENACFGYFINGNPENDPQFWHGGIPVSEKPTGLSGFYKCNIPVGDTSIILASFSKEGVNIGFYAFKLYGQHSSYLPFSFTFDPPLAFTPDSMMFGATSSSAPLNQAVSAIDGGTIQLDAVSFTGLSIQPELLNSDFELWTTQTINKPSSWYLNNGELSGVDKTTDSHAGDYAIELNTIAGEDNGIPVARNAVISTGYYRCEGNNCYMMGGFPYDKQNDALCFWYKYIPTEGDTAQASIAFKKNGSIINWSGARLHASSSYQYMEIPFNYGLAPDTAIVEFQSSIWEHRSLNYVGSKLIIDDAVFKSQQSTVGLFNQRLSEKISVFPNPCNGIVNIRSDIKISSVEIQNLIGETVYSARFNDGNFKIDLSDQPNGIYFYTLKHEKDIIRKGKIIIK